MCDRLHPRAARRNGPVGAGWTSRASRIRVSCATCATCATCACVCVCMYVYVCVCECVCVFSECYATPSPPSRRVRAFEKGMARVRVTREDPRHSSLSALSGKIARLANERPSDTTRLLDIVRSEMTEIVVGDAAQPVIEFDLTLTTEAEQERLTSFLSRFDVCTRTSDKKRRRDVDMFPRNAPAGPGRFNTGTTFPLRCDAGEFRTDDGEERDVRRPSWCPGGGR